MYVYDALLITHRFSHYVHNVCKSVLKLCLKLGKKKKQYYIKMKYLRQNGNKCFIEYISEKSMYKKGVLISFF